MKKLISIIALGTTLGVVPGLSNAASLDTTTAGPPNDGILQNFTGIDWHANGGGWVQGFDLTGANNAGDSDTFSFTYQAFAAAIDSSNLTPNLRVGAPGPGLGTYELTTYAVVTETAICQNAGCSSINIITNSGLWDIYFDNTPDANQAAGTGFIDGVNILSGTWDSGFSTFGANAIIGSPGAIGSGGGTLFGTVTTTNNAYVNPNLLGTSLQSSLIFPGLNNFTRPAAFNGTSTGANTPANFVIQTDTSQGFTAASVPEPGIMMLLGAGILGLGFRRKFS